MKGDRRLKDEIPTSKEQRKHQRKEDNQTGKKEKKLQCNYTTHIPGSSLFTTNFILLYADAFHFIKSDSGPLKPSQRQDKKKDKKNEVRENEDCITVTLSRPLLPIIYHDSHTLTLNCADREPGWNRLNFLSRQLQECTDKSPYLVRKDEHSEVSVNVLTDCLIHCLYDI